jgi:hypothetical protein
MPCYYTGTAEGDAKLQRNEANKALTKVTRLLCRLCRHHDKYSLLDMPPEVRKWWKKHQMIDNKRKAKSNERGVKRELVRNKYSKANIPYGFSQS